MLNVRYDVNCGSAQSFSTGIKIMKIGIFENDEVVDNKGDYIKVESMRIDGQYRLSKYDKPSITLDENRRNNPQESRIRARLGTKLIDQIRSGVTLPIVDHAMVERAKSTLSALSVPQRAHRLLEFIARPDFEAHIGVYIHSLKEAHEAALGVTESIEKDELMYFIRYLEEKDLIRNTPDGFGYFVTVEGYEAIERRKNVEGSVEVFIAMWFDSSTKSLGDAIWNAVKMSGYEPVRIDQTPHNNLIDDEIISHIRSCKFVIADLTEGHDGNRGSVYYEAGFARGLNKNVIQTVRKDILDGGKIAFDLDHYPTITWVNNDLTGFKDVLRNRIEALFGRGPLLGGIESNETT